MGLEAPFVGLTDTQETHEVPLLHTQKAHKRTLKRRPLCKN